MGANKEIVKQQIADLKDYTDTVAAVHLLKEVVTNGAVVTIGSAKESIAIENTEKDPKIGNVVKAILAKAGTPGEGGKWVQSLTDGKQHLEAAITIGGAIYTVDMICDGTNVDDGVQNYTVNITSKVDKEVTRGKLFFDNEHSATVKLTYNKEGDLHAVTKKGLAVDTKSFIPHAYQNEILAKFHDSLKDGKEQRLAVMGTGSGKSIVMAGIAQAIGRTVMIVPDKTLVDQQAGETRTMLGAGLVNGVKKTPEVFTLDTLKTLVDVDWDKLIDQDKLAKLKSQVEVSEWEKMSTNWDWLVEKKVIAWDRLDVDDIADIKENFAKVMAKTSDKQYDQIVLQAEHPLFKIIANEIKDSMVLIDESHRHTFNEEDANLLKGLQDRNSILALTATPTSKLYDLFAGTPLDDLSLGAAIDLGTIRAIQPEVSYPQEKDLIDQAVLHYFDDYYLTEKSTGYADPVALKKQILQEHSELEDSVAQEMAIDKALELNRIRAQRNMGFSDDKAAREKLAEVYQKIANGDVATIDKYKGKIAELRQASELKARVALANKFGPANVEEVSKKVPLRTVNLKEDIDKEQQKDIQRTINSYALALVFNDKYTDIAEKDRTHKLEEYLKECDKNIQKYKTSKDGEIPPPFSSKLKECEGKNRSKLEQALGKLTQSPIPKLPKEQKDAIVKLILDRAEAMVDKIKHSQPLSDLVTEAEDVDLAALKATENYAGAIDTTSPQAAINEQLAQIEVGIRTHIVADQVIATGVSIRDILNVQIINSYSPVIESDINVINGILSGPQAAGRCVRNKDVSARAQQYIDERYQDKGLILTVEEVIDSKESATKTRKVMENRKKQAQEEEKAITRIQGVIKGKPVTMFGKFQPLDEKIDQLKKDLKVAEDMLQDRKIIKGSLLEKLEQLDTLRMKLDLSETTQELELIPGRKVGQSTTAYTGSSFFYLQWARENILRSKLKLEESEDAKLNKEAIEKIKVEIKSLDTKEVELERVIKEGTSQLKKMESQLESQLAKEQRIDRTVINSM